MNEAGEGNDATVEEQAAIMRTFLEGLVEAFDLEATFAEDRVDDDTIELRVEGDNLGLLIGPKGQTLQSVQERRRFQDAIERFEQGHQQNVLSGQGAESEQELLERLRLWKRCSQFRADTDWIFASPMKIGRLPYSYNGVLLTLQRAADAAGIGKLTTHAFRHSYRTWLNQTGAPIATQQKLMRHAQISTTMMYGNALMESKRDANSKVVRMALRPVLV